MQTDRNFRSDINALRALALLLVLLFHFSIPGFGGGFLGVDVFFVISGYLMTRIIFDRSERGSFSLLAFYLDRARRIIPALALMVVVVGFVGIVILIPNKLLLFGKHAAAALTFTSNFLFWSEAGYFTPNAESKWLLHTWSLSVEWQFYIIYPVIVSMLLRMGSRKLAVASVVALTVLSFALSVWLAEFKPTTGFFLLPGRVWEMTAGGLVYLFPVKLLESRRVGLAAQIIGLTLILSAAAIFVGRGAWPGAGALIPVIGAMLIISAGQASIVTTNPVVAWLGRSSYSTYLWHWPVVCGLSYLGLGHSPGWTAAGMAVSFILGGLSYHLLETRSFLKRPVLTTKGRALQLVAFASVCFLISIAGAGLWRSRGLPQRFPSEIVAADSASRDVVTFDKGCFGPAADVPSCVFGGDGRNVALEVVGDSHAQAMLQAIVDALPARDALRYHASPACPTIATALLTDPESKCWEFNRRFLDPLIEGPRSDVPLLIINNWTMPHGADVLRFASVSPKGLPVARGQTGDYEQELRTTVCRLTRTRKVFLTAPLPTFRVRVAETLAADLVFNRNAPDISKPLSEHIIEHDREISTMKRVASACGAVLLDPTPLICPQGVCKGSDQHVPIYKDQHHLTATGATRLTPMFRSIFVASH
jgi:peptidoglycan/LPS O-acetylase OafA/YrhL